MAGINLPTDITFADEENNQATESGYWGQLLFGDERAFVNVDGIVFAEPCTASDNTLAVLDQFPDIRYLAIDTPNIGEKGLARLKCVPHLQELYIPSITLTDSALAEIGSLQSLQIIQIKRSTSPSSQERLRAIIGKDCVIETLAR
jgi:hypothetical protein